jgi:hypothetical protein
MKQNCGNCKYGYLFSTELEYICLYNDKITPNQLVSYHCEHFEPKTFRDRVDDILPALTFILLFICVGVFIIVR